MASGYRRQVDLILQNTTYELLTLEAFMPIQGAFIPSLPDVGSVVSPQGAGRWTSEARTTGMGVVGFLRLGSTKGYITLSWELHHDASKYSVSVDVPEGLYYELTPGGQGPDLRTEIVTLKSVAPKESKTTSARRSKAKQKEEVEVVVE